MRTTTDGGSPAAPLTALPEAALALDGDGGTPAALPVAGTPDTQAEGARRAEDEIVLDALISDLETHVGPRPVVDPVGGTGPDKYRLIARGVLGRLTSATGETISAGGAGLDTEHPSVVFRRALGVPATDPLPADAATRLLKRATGLDDPYEVIRCSRQRRSLPDDQRSDIFSSSPDEGDSVAAAIITSLEGDDDDRLGPDAALGTGVTLSESFRDLLRVMRRFYGQATSGMKKHTDDEGQLAHTIITMHYWITHPASTLIMDRYAVVASGLSALETLALAAKNDATLAEIASWLISEETGLVGQPDIFDLSTREVWEIKPILRMYDAAGQLFGRYLLPLNTGAFGGGGAGRQLAATFLGAIPASGLIPPGIVPDGVRPFVPGVSWTPASIYPLPDGRMMYVRMPAPGIIGYQIVGSDEEADDPDGPTMDEMIDELVHGLMAMIAAAAGILAGAGGEAPEGLRPVSPVTGRPLDMAALSKAGIATAAAALVIEVVQALGPLVVLLLAL